MTLILAKRNVYMCGVAADSVISMSLVQRSSQDMCVGAMKGTFRRDIKMIVIHDYKNNAKFMQKIFWVDYTSKYCLLSMQLSSACIYTPQHTNFGCFVCACC